MNSAPRTPFRRSRMRLTGADRPAAAARRHARETLTGWGVDDDVLDVAELVVSELVTNAAEHAEGGVTELHLTLSARGVRVAVVDHDLRLPAARLAGEDAEDGRGMAIVCAVADAHGCTVTDQHKTVWACVPTPDPQPAAALTCVVA